MEFSQSLIFTPVAFLHPFITFVIIPVFNLMIVNTCIMFQLCVDPEMKPKNSFGTDFYYQDRFSSPSPVRSLFHAVCLCVEQRWDRLYDQQVRPSWLLRVCQYADGYHHRRDARRAARREKRDVCLRNLDSFWLQIQISHFLFFPQ